MDLRLEAVVIPVSDVDRAKTFYRSAGFREDIDFVSGHAFRVVQFTPPGSLASIIFGTGITDAHPGALDGLLLVTEDVEAARARLLERGVAVGRVVHDAGRVFLHRAWTYSRDGPDPDRRDYASFAHFVDPDGNGWVLQEVRQRCPGR